MPCICCLPEESTWEAYERRARSLLTIAKHAPAIYRQCTTGLHAAYMQRTCIIYVKGLKTAYRLRTVNPQVCATICVYDTCGSPASHSHKLCANSMRCTRSWHAAHIQCRYTLLENCMSAVNGLHAVGMLIPSSLPALMAEQTQSTCNLHRNRRNLHGEIRSPCPVGNSWAERKLCG